MIRDLRAALGPRVPLIALDGLLISEFVEAAGSAAQGLYLGVYGIPNHQLPPEGNDSCASSKPLTRVKRGILGDIRFDRNGDPLRGPVTIVRVAGKGPGFVPEVPGTVFDRVVVARAELLR